LKRSPEQQRQLDAAHRMFDAYERQMRGEFPDTKEKEHHTDVIAEARERFDKTIRDLEDGRGR